MAAARAMATVAFLLLALLPVPGAQGQVTGCSATCTTTYDSCMEGCRYLERSYCVGDSCKETIDGCGGGCEKTRDACTGTCDRDCAGVDPSASAELESSCTTGPCATVYNDCFNQCTTGGGTASTGCSSACEGGKNFCIRTCKFRCGAQSL